MARTTPEELAQKAQFIFQGTVRQRGAATIANIPVSDKTLLVHVDNILQAPRALTTYSGQDITVQLSPSSRAKLETGQQFVFYTNGWLFAESIAVQAVGQLPMRQAQPAMAAAADPQETLATRQLQRRLDAADTVVTGRVTAVREPVDEMFAAEAAPAAEAHRARPVVKPISEHDPEWREAVIAVQQVEKGTTNRSQVVVRFPSSDDIQWRYAPKFAVGQEGVFVLHEKQLQSRTSGALAAAEAAPAEEEVYVALDPADFQPTQQLPVVRTLVAQQN
jgi:hypothetical protein